MDGIKGMMPL